MINLEKIAEELFNKIRGRYPSITIGDDESTITNVPSKARFFDFDFKEGVKVSVTLDENSLTMLYNNDLIEKSEDTVRSNWYNFMKEMRTFAKKRMLNFDTRDITKSNLDKRDYQYLSTNRPGENTMSESKMYGTSKTSFQDIGNAKLIVKHRGPVDFENPAGRTHNIDSIYIESAEGERYKYPYRHLNGARAMATHVSEGGKQYDDFGKHIVSLSEELSKLRTFKTYMNRSAVMAEGLAGYMDIVNNRIDTVKETVHKLQRENFYKEAFENFESKVLEEVPEDVSSNWIDELTIKQFNEDLKSVFPYIYNLVKENTKTTQVSPEDLLGEDEIEEGAVKRAMEDDAESMSKEEFMKKHGGPNADDEGASEFYDNYNGTEDESLDMENNFASHLDNVIATSKHEQGPNEVSSMGMNKYGLAAKKEGGKFISYKDGEVTGEFDSMEELAKHQQELIQDESATFEGNEFAQKVRELKAKGAKPGTKFKTSDGEEHTLESAIEAAGLDILEFWSEDELEESGIMYKAGVKKYGKDGMKKIQSAAGKGASAEEIGKIKDQHNKKKESDDDTMDVKMTPDGGIQKVDAQDKLHQKEEELPLEEFIKGHFDYTTNQFPKGETAVMTAVEKKYGEEAIRNATEIMQELVTNQDEEMNRIKTLAGLEY